MHRCAVGGSWWQSLNTPRPYTLAILILAGILLEFVVHFRFGIPIVYTHFYYLIIVLAGLWYGRRGAPDRPPVRYPPYRGLVPDIGDDLARCPHPGRYVCDCCADRRDDKRTDRTATAIRLIARNSEFEEANTRLEASQHAFQTANKKLNLLSSITRHDIKNQLLALMGFIALSKMKTTDPGLLHFVEQEETAANTIQRQIEFTKNYEDIGVHAPQWQDIRVHLNAIKTLIPREGITVSVDVNGLEVYADPLLEKVFENLIDNSIRHGERVRHISFSTLQYGLDYIAIVYEDDGIGIHEADKERIFEKGFGKNTGLGLFLTREILAITGLEIKESGMYGQGARFEILVPKGMYRFLATAGKRQKLTPVPVALSVPDFTSEPDTVPVQTFILPGIIFVIVRLP